MWGPGGARGTVGDGCKPSEEPEAVFEAVDIQR